MTRIRWVGWVAIVLLVGVVNCPLAIGAAETTEGVGTDSSITAHDESTRVLITTSGSGVTRLKHRQLDNPPRIVVQFLTRNVMSAMTPEVVVNRGIIQSVRAEYYEVEPVISADMPRPLRALTFTLVDFVPYEIIAEGDSVLISIKNPPSLAGMDLPLGQLEIPAGIARQPRLSMRDEALLSALEVAEFSLATQPISDGTLSERIDEILARTTAGSMQPFGDAAAELPANFGSAVVPPGQVDGTRPTYVPPSWAWGRSDDQAVVDFSLWNNAAHVVRWIGFVCLAALICGFLIGAILWWVRGRGAMRFSQRSRTIERELKDLRAQLDEQRHAIEREHQRRRQLEEELQTAMEALEAERAYREAIEQQLADHTQRVHELDKDAAAVAESRFTFAEITSTDLSEDQETFETVTTNQGGLSLAQGYGGPERREMPRLDLPPDEEYVACRWREQEGGETIQEGRITSLSSGGLAFKTTMTETPSDSMVLELVFDESVPPVEVMARPVWQRNLVDGEGALVGAVFDQVDGQAQDSIDGYLEERWSQDTTLVLQKERPGQGTGGGPGGGSGGDGHISGTAEVSLAKEPADDRPRTVAFRYFAPHAQEVRVMGAFNGWEAAGGQMQRNDYGYWEAELQLPVGRYEYGFMVDGAWRADPENPQTTPNAFGSVNSVLEVSENFGADIVPFRLYAPNASSVCLSGDFNNWSNTSHPMHQEDDGWWVVRLLLSSGTYRYKFWVDERWQVDPRNTRRESDGFDGINCVVVID